MRVRDCDSMRLHAAAALHQTMPKQGERVLCGCDEREYTAGFEYGRRNVHKLVVQSQRN